MSDTTSIFTKTKVTILEPLFDSLTFIGSGLLATSYFTTWINPPMSTAGIFFAALLNASSICGAKKIAKTDESNSLFNKTLVTLGALALSTITIPYIAVPLANRIGIITGKAAFHLGVLNLSTKAGTFVLYLLGSHFLSSTKIALSSTEIDNMKEPELKKYYNHFVKIEGHQDWYNLEKDIQLAFLARFEKENLLFSGQFNIKCHELTDDDIRKYNTTIWNVLLSFSDSKLISSISLLQIRCFKLDLAPPENAYREFYFDLQLSNKPKEIQTYTKNQALWIFHYILAKQPTLGKKTLDAYIDLFDTHDLFLPTPTIDEIQNFRLAEVQLYYAAYSEYMDFEKLPLELQFELSNFFEATPEIDDGFWLQPHSAQEITEASDEIIRKLHEESEDPDGNWDEFPPVYLTALNNEYERRFGSN